MYKYIIIKKMMDTWRLSFTSLSKAWGENLGMEDTLSDMNLPMLLSGAMRPSWDEYSTDNQKGAKVTAHAKSGI